MLNKHYTLNFYKSYIELEINFIPEDDFTRNKLYYDLILYYEIDNVVIRYKNKIFNNEKELKSFFKLHKNGIELKDICKIYVTTV